MSAARSASVEAGVKPVIDLNFFDRRAAADQARAFNASLRYVDHEVYGDPAGVMIEDSAVNGVEDAGYDGAGDYPTGWQVKSRSGDANVTFTRTGPAESRVRVRGESADEIFIVTGSSRHFAVKTGELLTGSAAIRIADGDPGALHALELLVLQSNADGTPASSPSTAAMIQPVQADKAWWAQVQQVAATNGFASLALRITTAAKFDLTLDLNFPQLEMRAWRSTFCAAARQSDDLSLIPLPNYLSCPRRSVVITADAPRYVPDATLWSEFADPANHVEVQLRDRVIYARVVAAGTARELRLGVLPPLMRFTLCLILKDDGFAASLNGKPLQSIDCAMPQGLKLARLGGGFKGSWNSTVGRLALFADAIADGASASRPQQTFFDDFDRPDSSSLGRSPTGQMIAQTGNSASRIADRKWVADETLGLVFAAYGIVSLPKPMRYLGTVLTWSPGSSSGGAGLIAATSNDFTRPIDALHAIVSDEREIFQTMTNSRVDKAFANFFYPVAMRRDGETPYGVACLLNTAESALIYVGPQGDLARHANPTYVKRTGSFAVFEHYWHLGQCRPEFLAVAAY